MKRLIIAAMAMLMTLGMSAQQHGGPRREFNAEEMATRQAKEVKETCNTTDEQYTAIYNLFLTQAQQMKAERDSIAKQKSADGQRPRFNMSAMKERQEKMNAAIKEILTEEQYTAYEKMQSNRQGRRGNGGNGGPRKEKKNDNSEDSEK